MRIVRGAPRLLILLLLLAGPVPVPADAAPRACTGHTWTNGQLILHLDDGDLALTLYSAHAIEAVFTPHEGAPNPPAAAIATRPQPPAATLLETEEGLLLHTDGLTLEVRQRPLRLRYRFRDRDLIEEDAEARAERVGFRFRLAAEEKLFGGGSRVRGRMNRRGERLTLYNSAAYGYETNAPLMYYSMPAVVSSRQYLLAFDNGARGVLDLDAAGDGFLRFDAVGGRRAYLLVAGASWPDLATRVADLTGHQPLLPRWALGSIASRMGYHAQAEVEAVVRGYRDADLPLDAIVLDLFWFSSSIFGGMGNLDWDRTAFPRPEAMLRSLRRQGIQTILITEPLILRASRNWDDAVERGVLARRDDGQPYTFASFFGEAALVDVFKPEARAWFWSHYRRHTRAGVAGWWGDLGEPETHPDDIRHVNGRGEDVHNLYGHAWAGLVYEGFRRDFPRQRPFILMRSGFVGTQRHGILPWSGDVARSWGGLKPQVELTLQMGLQGIGYMHSDLGGFAGNRRDPELYVRWLQYGAFQPLFRPHGHEEVPSEPIFWDEATQRIVRRYLQLRYQLLPYNYTLMYENAVDGLPLMRPLFYADAAERLEDRVDTYLWGDAFLVAPVTDPGARQREIPLPAGAWFDWWTGRRHAGGGTITVPVDLENIPVLVRAGAFVPMTAPIRNTRQYDPANIWVHHFADDTVTSSSGRLYDDDGASPDAVAKRRYELLQFRSARTAEGNLELHVDGERHHYRGRPDRRLLRLVVHALPRRPDAIRVDDRAVPVIDGSPPAKPDSGAYWNAAEALLTVPVEWSGRPRRVTIPALREP